MIRIDMVSDIACPWCAIGLATLENALEDLSGTVEAEIHVQPFELDPEMPEGGTEIIEHLSNKYGIDREQVLANQARIRERAEIEGFPFHPDGRSRAYNTFDCHRLLHWAHETAGWQKALDLKKALLGAYFTEAANMDDKQTLLDAVAEVGLDTQEARQILESDAWSQEVRQAQTRWKMLGIQAVPAFILDNHFLVQGGQSREYFVSALQQAKARQDALKKGESDA